VTGQPTDPAVVDDVLGFWFGDLDENGLARPGIEKRWWTKDPAFDAEIERRFEGTRRALLAGAAPAWLGTPRGRPAAVIVLDQFSRNVGRGTPAAFAADGVARELAEEGLRRGDDGALPPAMRAFLYMPLMHAEDPAAQARCCALFRKLQASVPAEVRDRLSGHVHAADRHREIVDRFGRFPHRNATLGRTSTPEERAFLEQPGSSF